MIAYFDGEREDGIPQGAPEAELQDILPRQTLRDAPGDTSSTWLVLLAARSLGMPVAMLALRDGEQLRITASAGLEPCELALAAEICELAREVDTALVVPDTASDGCAGKAAGAGRFRFFAAAPLTTDAGERLGLLCVLDRKARADFDAGKAAVLDLLTQGAMSEFELQRKTLTVGRHLAAHRLWNRMSQLLADAPDFRAAVQHALELCTQHVGASLSMIVELTWADRMVRYVAHFVPPGPDTAIDAAIWSEPASLDRLSYGRALEQNRSSDTGPIGSLREIARFPYLQRLAVAGMHRQLTFPFDLDGRRFGLILGYTATDAAAGVADFVSAFTVRLRPLLLGRLREDALRHANRALKTLRACAAAQARAADATALLREACRIAVDVGGYTTAWIGLAEHDDRQSVRTVARAGFRADITDRLNNRWADCPQGRGPTGTAIRERRIFVAQDVLRDPRFAPWHELIRDAGFMACSAIPLLTEQGDAIGALTLCTREPASFDPEEQRLLSDLAADLMRGLAALRSHAERDAARAAQRAGERRMTRLLEASSVVLCSLRRAEEQLVITDVSANITALLGYSPEEIRAPGWWQAHLHPDDRAGAIAAATRALDAESVQHRYRIAHKSGGYRWISDEMRPGPEDDAGRMTITAVWIDITSQHDADEQIYRLAYLDPLTGLPNRRLLHDRLEQALKTARRTRHRGAVLMLDLDHLKTINEAMGRTGGDAALVEVVRRLRGALRAEDTVARLGSDEFVILMPRLSKLDAEASEQAQGVAAKLDKAIAETPVLIGGRQWHLSAGIGVTLFGKRGDTVDTILGEVDTALHRAKTSDGDRIRFFELAMQQAVTSQLAIESELRAALAQNRFELWLQGQVAGDGRVIGAEALLRLRKPDGSIVPPGIFIGIAETSRLIIPIGRWVLHSACELLATTAGSDLRIAVNVSPLQFRDPNFVMDVEAALARSGADPARLTLEITEGLLIRNVEDAAATMIRLAALGVRFSVDDFGTGYSSLSYLQRLPIDEIKIDRSFVAQLPDGAAARAIIEAILAMAEQLQIDVVAEGVETIEQAAHLTARRCAGLQGYLFDKPAPAHQWLAGAVGIAKTSSRQIAQAPPRATKAAGMDRSRRRPIADRHRRN